MEDEPLTKVLSEICRKDRRYQPGAYLFVLDALGFTAKVLNKPDTKGAERHITGAELLDGIRIYALQEFGPMAMTVFDSWGISETQDFGEIVFNLVDAGRLRKTDQDRREDFANGYDFSEAFARPFLPAGAEAGAYKSRRGKRERRARKERDK
ncbi:Minf_1886 family protein [Verrucomicrobiota bacterium]